MRRLLEDFGSLFDLDYPIRGIRLGELIEGTIADLNVHSLPEWGTPGPISRVATEKNRSISFYYVPHLFQGMDLKLSLAHKLQFHLLPRELPPDAPVSIAAALESYCHLSGDLFGWEMLSDGKFLIWIVDVSGHGVRAGLASAVLEVILAQLRGRSRVDVMVSQLNDALNGCVRAEYSSLFATGFFVAIGEDGTAVYTSAGHPPALLRRRDGSLTELRSNSRPVGLFPDQPYQIDETRLAPGEILLLYTDGLLEATSDAGEEFGLHRLRSVLGEEFDTPEALAGTLYRTVARHQDMARLDDDITFVAARLS
jgi:sigma-B regulation protein RsbU (phosphoserine phosphatase)